MDQTVLKDARQKIDTIDEQIVRLLEKRFQVVMEVGEIKKQNNLPIHNPKREEEVLQRVESLANNKYLKKIIKNIYLIIIEASRNSEK
jgi:monofunctional chorismate mutase